MMLKSLGENMKLIKNGDVYAPKYLGKKDIFIAGGKIYAIEDEIEVPKGLDVEVIDATGLKVMPGFVDSHVHVLGGGGEGGFANRTPEGQLSDFTRYGITTVVGCLGTDGIGRDMKALVAKIKGLKEEGLSAYCYTGSYQVPVRTITADIITDIMMIEEVIGVGEIAISDHRSSQPTFEEFARICGDARVAGILSGKAGIINTHLGDGERCLDLIERVVFETEIPPTQFLPTHINRNEMLFKKGIEFAKKGGTVDFTGNEDIDYWETICDEVRVSTGIKRMLDAGVSIDQITISSDGQGSLPIFSKEGKYLGIGIGQSSCLLKEVKECLEREDLPLEMAIKPITENPARILHLKGKGQIATGFDGDITMLDENLGIHTVIAKGQTMVEAGEVVRKGKFEDVNLR